MQVREPVGPIQVLPVGLLNLLQIKSGGTNPDALRQDVQPTVEVGEYWLRARRKTLAGAYSFSLAGPGTQNAVINVTPGGALLTALGPGQRAWWFVHEYSALWSTAAASSGTHLALGISKPGGPTGPGVSNVIIAPEVPVTAIAASAVQPISARGFWVPPGWFIGGWVGSYTGTLALNVQAFEYTELPL